MSKHTPGKWLRFNDSTIISDGEHPDPKINGDEHRSLYGGGALVAESIFNPGDVRLFVAAPLMLACLKRFVEWYGKRGGPSDAVFPQEEQDSEIREAMIIIAEVEVES